MEQINNTQMKEKKDVTVETGKIDEVEKENADVQSEKGNKNSAKKAKTSRVKSAEKKLKGEIEFLNQANGELKDKYLRLVAEYDNFRKRTAKEKVDLRETTKSVILSDFLSIVDDVDRAMSHIDDVKDLEATIEGVKLINNKFKDFLKIQGVEEIEAKDMDFDTDLHEAITKFPVEEEDRKGKVIDVVQKGYKINDKVIRFTKVVVGE